MVSRGGTWKSKTSVRPIVAAAGALIVLAHLGRASPAGTTSRCRTPPHVAGDQGRPR